MYIWKMQKEIENNEVFLKQKENLVDTDNDIIDNLRKIIKQRDELLDEKKKQQ